MSMFPRVLFNVTQSSVRRGLAGGGTRFQLPFQLAKKIAPRFEIDFEAGPRVSTVGRSALLYGVVAGADSSKRTSLMAELHGESRMNLDEQALTLNVGRRQSFNEHVIWIGSLGHELRSPNAPTAFVGNCGLLLVY